MKAQAVRLEGDTVELLKKLTIEMGGIKLKSYDDKIKHLIWHFHSNRNNNGNTK